MESLFCKSPNRCGAAGAMFLSAATKPEGDGDLVGDFQMAAAAWCGVLEMLLVLEATFRK